MAEQESSVVPFPMPQETKKHQSQQWLPERTDRRLGAGTRLPLGSALGSPRVADDVPL